MSLSRIEADRYRTPDENYWAKSPNCCRHAATLAELRGCKVECRIEPDLPLVMGDFGQLLQLADNLIGNAIRYGCSDKACAATVSVHSDGQQVTLSVSDEGDGIPAVHLPRLTERFYRVDSARSRDRAAPAGWQSSNIVERHRGTLEIQSELGKGTGVNVSLPAS
jgi:two-component system phosphate regulon sensor histidine kinase PhoR